MKFGIIFANIGPWQLPDNATAMGQIAEEFGIESLWCVEHVVVPKGYESAYPYSPDGRMPGPENSPIPDPLVWMTWVAAKTTTIRLATGVLILPQRNPLVLAKEVATMDVLSGGRIDLGIGVGWLEEEFDAIGIPFKQRGSRTDETVAALRAAWTQSPATHAGKYHNFTDVYVLPQPVQPGGVPIHVGGHTEIAARRAGRLGDGFFPAQGGVAELPALLDVMRKEAADHGRDGDKIEVTAGASFNLDEIRQLGELGVSRLMIPPLAFDPDGLRQALDRFQNDIISKV
ncbi:MAG: LLM class F420-dependent oxidoreductase [Acidimicrobiales bacterium]|nr:LLM class F420-dependent oxidoreductase [Acidimicrobiales bacterium]